MDKVAFGIFYWPMRQGDPIRFAQRIEELGFDSLWVPESPTNRNPSLDAFSVLCYAAAATERIRLGTNVLLLPLHHPVWVAKQWGTLDRLSHGRTILGIGLGGEFPKQFEAFGIPVSERGRRANEAIEVIKALWTQAEVDFHGRCFQFDGIVMDPKPLQQPHPPIWVGGRPGGTEVGPDGKPRFKSRTASLVRAARYADGWCPYYMAPDSYRESVVQVKEYAASLGRDISQMAWSYNTRIWIRESYEAALNEAKARLRYGRDLGNRVEGFDILGTARDTIAKIQKFADAGVQHLVLSVEASDDELDDHLVRLATEIVPHFR